MALVQKEWFEEWFDSPYYDLLYRKRNEEEAALFLENLLKRFHFSTTGRLLDLACGKGRHSVYLHKKGFDVTGADLSRRSIEYASQFEAAGLRFEIHDMREPLQGKHFKFILNLFTSFGYFETQEENTKVLRSVKQMLEPEGIFVLDYLNSLKVAQTLVEEECRSVADVLFHIRRKVENQFVVKEIDFSAENRPYHFKEKVRIFTLGEFENMFAEAGLQLLHVFGDYSLNPYHESTSERLILIARN